MNPGTSYKHYLSPEHNPLRNVTHKRNNEDLLHAKSTKNGIKLCKVTVFIAWTLLQISSSFTSKLFWGVLCCKTLKQFSFQSCSPANQLSYWRWHFGQLIGFKSLFEKKSEGIWKNNDQALWIKIPNYKKIRNDLLARRCKSAAFGTIYGTSIFGQYCIVN